MLTGPLYMIIVSQNAEGSWQAGNPRGKEYASAPATATASTFNNIPAGQVGKVQKHLQEFSMVWFPWPDSSTKSAGTFMSSSSLRQRTTNTWFQATTLKVPVKSYMELIGLISWHIVTGAFVGGWLPWVGPRGAKGEEHGDRLLTTALDSCDWRK